MITNEQIVKEIKSGKNEKLNIEKLYKMNKGLIFKIANHYKSLAEFDDLCQEGFIGLMMSVNLWDPDGGASFSTYAFKMIRATMRRYIENNGHLIRLPSRRFDRVLQYKRALESFRMSFNREPSPDELSEILKVDPDQIEEIKIDAVLLDPKSIDERIRDSETDTIGSQLEDKTDQIGKILDDIERKEISRVLWKMVDALSEKDAFIIREKYQNGLTLKECGEKLGVSTESARKRELKALKYLRSIENKEKLIPYIEERISAVSYNATGLATFKKSWMSAPERAVILKMEIEERSAMMSV